MFAQLILHNALIIIVVVEIICQMESSNQISLFCSRFNFLLSVDYRVNQVLRDHQDCQAIK